MLGLRRLKSLPLHLGGGGSRAGEEGEKSSAKHLTALFPSRVALQTGQ